MSESTKPTLNEAKNGNKSKPLLQAVFLAPYLPYDLKVKTVQNEIVLVEGIYTFEDIYNSSVGDIPFDLIVPILKPISDLSLLVIEEFEKYDGKRNGKANEEIINIFCEENGVDEIIDNIELKSLPYECVEFMFKNHYDFFGLIGKGLAVSIHDVV
jgi:hypothetical protein